VTRPAISVIIPTHDRRESVTRAVTALLAQEGSDESEVIVACDRDGTQEALRRRFGDRVRVVDAACPGQTGAYNAGIAIARADVLLFVDDDMEPLPGFIRGHLEAHREIGDQPTAVVGFSEPLLSPGATKLQRAIASRLEELLRELARPDHRSTPADLTGGNFSIRRPVIDAAGGFDETFRFLCNDFELAARLLLSGARFVLAPAARARTRIDVTPVGMIERATERARNEHRLALRYPMFRAHLPFYAPGSTRRWRRRLLWAVGPTLAPLAASARWLLPESLRLLGWACSARYVKEARRSIGTWREYEALVEGPPPATLRASSGSS
jgi:GT2 family glycosyltransferase